MDEVKINQNTLESELTRFTNVTWIVIWFVRETGQVVECSSETKRVVKEGVTVDDIVVLNNPTANYTSPAVHVH